MCKARFKAISKHNPGQPPRKKRKADTVHVQRRDANFHDDDYDISQYLNDDDYDETLSSGELITRLASGFFSFLDHFLAESDSESDISFENQTFSNIDQEYMIEQDQNGRTVIDLTSDQGHQATPSPRHRIPNLRRPVPSPYILRTRTNRVPRLVSRPNVHRRNNARRGGRSTRVHTSSPNSTTTTTTTIYEPSVDITIFSSTSNPGNLLEVDLFFQ